MGKHRVLTINEIRNKIFCGDAMQVLKWFPRKSISCCVTSPPYLGLRDYTNPDSIFGGDPLCVHEWEVVKALRKWTPGDMPGPNSLINKNRSVKENRPQEDTLLCTKCGAWKGSLGLEPTPHLFVKHLCDIFDEVREVLRDDGTLWVNLGDSYAGSGGAGGDWTKGQRALEPKWRPPRTTLPAKTMFLVPSLFAIEMVYNRGWRLRNENIWAKTCPMPHPSRDKFNVSHEPFYFFVKAVKPQYHVNEVMQTTAWAIPSPSNRQEGVDWEWKACMHCNGTGRAIEMGACPACKTFMRGWVIDGDGQLVACSKCGGTGMAISADEPCKKCNGTGKRKQTLWSSREYWFLQQLEPLKNPSAKGNRFGGNKRAGGVNPTYSGRDYDATELAGRIKRDVWVLGTSKHKGKHYATFPPELVETPIRAGCPVKICRQCGLPVEYLIKIEGRLGHSWHDHSCDATRGAGQDNGTRGSNYKNYERFLVGSTNCGCNAGYDPGIVMDPFNGAGTTMLVAILSGRDAVGIDISPEYVRAARERIKNALVGRRLDDMMQFGLDYKGPSITIENFT